MSDLAFTAELVERGLYKLAREIAAKHHVTVEEIGSDLKLRFIVDARRDFILALREKGMSYPAIGLILHRDQSSVQSLAKATRRASSS